MEKEQILSTLTEKLGQTSFSQQSLQTYVDNNLPADGAEPDDAYWTRHISVLKSFQGQFNHDVATKVTEQASAKFEEYKKNWKPEPPKGGEEPKKEDSEEISALKQEIEDLKRQFSDNASRMTQAELMAKVKAAMKTQNATDAYVLEKTLQGKVLDATKSVEDLTAAMLAEYDKEYKACRGDGAAPRMGNGSPSGKSKLDLRFEAKKRRQEASK